MIKFKKALPLYFPISFFGRSFNLLMRVCLAFAILVSTACNQNDVSKNGASVPDDLSTLPALSFRVDNTISGGNSFVSPTLDDSENIGFLVNDEGTLSAFIAGEIALQTKNPNDLDDILERWNGELVDHIDYAEFGLPDLPDLYIIRINISDNDIQPDDIMRITNNLVASGERSIGEQRVSSQAALRTIGIAAEEAAQRNRSVSLNWVLTGTNDPWEGLMFGTLSDGQPSPSATTYTANPFDWPYMQVGGPMDIGVASAWSLLEDSDRLDNRVDIMIADGGFYPHDDFPEDSEILRGSWNVDNPNDCGGNACPDHGTNVTAAAMGVANNGYGAAGAAGFTGNLQAVHLRETLWRAMPSILRRVRDHRPAVLNMSFKTQTSTANLALKNHFDNMMLAIGQYNTLIFASAGNEGADIDRKQCGPGGNTCWEKYDYYPCESRNVICVGGLDWNSYYKHGNSNWGSQNGTRTVDIYCPYTVYVSDGNDGVKRSNGTSISSPFCAGIAALIKAAKPSLDADEIWEIMRNTAHDHGVMNFTPYNGTRLRANALKAVTVALDSSGTPPNLRILKPDNNSNFGRGDFISLQAETFDIHDGGPVEVQWSSDRDGVLGVDSPGATGRTVTGLSDGEHRITATAKDNSGRTTEATIQVDITNEPAMAAILAPTADTIFFPHQQIRMIGQAYDPDGGNGGHGNYLTRQQIEWRVHRVSSQNGTINAIPSVTKKGRRATLSPGTLSEGEYELRMIADPGEDNDKTIVKTRMFVGPSAPNRPRSRIDSPLDASFEITNQNDEFGAFVQIEAQGRGIAANGNELDGRRLTWTIYHRGQRRVICRGGTGTLQIGDASSQPLSLPNNGINAVNFITTSSMVASSSIMPVNQHLLPETGKDCSTINLKLYAINGPDRNFTNEYVLGLTARRADGRSSAERLHGISLDLPPVE